MTSQNSIKDICKDVVDIFKWCVTRADVFRDIDLIVTSKLLCLIQNQVAISLTRQTSFQDIFSNGRLWLVKIAL